MEQIRPKFSNVTCVNMKDHAGIVVKNDTKKIIKDNNDFRPIIQHSGYNGNFVEIKGVKWYYRLVTTKNYGKSLLDYYKNKNLTGKIIVQFVTKNLDKYIDKNKDYIVEKKNDMNKNIQNDRENHLFAIFDSYVAFFKYKNLFEENEQNFFETILGAVPQKPKFDIDIEYDKYKKYTGKNGNESDFENLIGSLGENIKNSVINESINLLQECGKSVNINTDICIYTSHGCKKRSYHIVINRKYHMDNQEAKIFSNLVKERVEEKNKGFGLFIDSSVYSSTQQFRIVGCQKPGSNRPKKFEENFYINNNFYQHLYETEIFSDAHKNLEILKESLITFVTNCEYIQIPTKYLPKSTYETTELSELDDKHIEVCMLLMKRKIKDCPFSFVTKEDNKIILKRNSPSFCPICQITHEYQNPYIFTVKNRVFWNCRRSTEYASGKSLSLGYIDTDQPKKLSQNINVSTLDVQSETKHVKNIVNCSRKKSARQNKKRTPQNFDRLDIFSRINTPKKNQYWYAGAPS